MASISKSTSVAARRTPFWESWLGKSVMAYLNCPGTRNPWIRHANLAGIIVLFWQYRRLDVYLSRSSRSTVKLNFEGNPAENGIGDVSYVEFVMKFS
ncbi:hypothetical protein AVEN_198205-1 [Araneus ventricosus]|uniref:Uncharacterized protein n=1 Tax=Araneus ventricosus TaxID=182803 RepID=A0A4Y2E7Z0_ARAVE|nr:hypothetical protein AVEN_198205-1 [Araneus ventricosus]